MKLAFLPADASNRHDGILQERLWQHIPNFVSSDADLTIVPISFFQDFRFNEALYQLKGKKYVVACTTEFYGEWPAFTTHLWGRDFHSISGNQEWVKFSEFVRDNPPVCQFIRELFADAEQENVYPLEWPCYLHPWAIEGKESFDSRPFEVSNFWGFSNCARPNLHGDIYKGWCKNAHEVIGNLDYAEAKLHEPVKKWLSVHIPHSHRRHINELVLWQSRAKIGVSLSGAGTVCFRSTEMINTIPAIHSQNKIWSYPWRNLVNCFHLTPGNEYRDLLDATKCDFLHNIYLSAVENMRNYETTPYINNYLLPILRKYL